MALAPGFALNVEVEGSGPPLVLLHGFTGSAKTWGPLAPLAERWTLVAFDIVGHGLSDSPPDLDHYAMETCVADLVAATGSLGFSRAHWLGYSMGGRTALHVAAAFPEAVRSLVLIGASPGIDCAEDRIARRSADELLARKIEAEGVEAFVDYWENIPLFSTQKLLPPEIRSGVRAGRLRNSAAGLANSLRGMGAGAQEPLHQRLASLTMPTLLLAGSEDTKYVAQGREMAAAMPHARFEVIDGAGHAAQLERPDRCLELIRGFLEDVEGADQHGVAP
ncbi:MAG: 2-succinyl-6-hydroxy-2,4-cyclohexadiene-1-carboxylate synthase [Chloroflexi bacterium]|nr:2-succinyl-6-hydroxy-2,4-cyclohexadiene-1-carboxylate synthase [Chloroflexota bacterium]